MQLRTAPGGFDLLLRGRVVLAHRTDAPALFVGRGHERIAMVRGNFDIEDRLEARLPLTDAAVDGDRIAFALPGRPALLTMTVSGDDRRGTLGFEAHAPLNRFWVRLPAEPDERVWGGGEQMSHLDLRGRRFPMWTSEPGVGRDKGTEITRLADVAGRAGGDYWTTNYPQPTFLSSRRIAVHVETTAWSALDFTGDAFHEIEAWAIPERIELFAEDSLLALVTAMADRFGRQPPLPDWAMQGAIVGLKDGERSFDRLDRIVAAGVPVTGLWCEDWAGVRQTSFGTRLFWNWEANEARYPRLPARIAALAGRGIRFLAYVSPYLCDDGALFAEAEAGGHLGRTTAGATYLVDFGEFLCGVLDFTDEATCRWFADRVLTANMMDIGVAGWMCDFGEYLPTDIVLKNGLDARLMHNAWPLLWARVNAEAVARAGRTGEVLFFMRAGFTGIQAHCPLLWAGDQCVDFSRHDGLVTAIVGALSSGLLGNAYHHSDIGGYTSLFGNVRTAELVMRWAELAAFTPVMRTHEGNRPNDNLQIDGDPAVLAHFARMARVHAALHPYLATLRADALAHGWPLQRALFLHHDEARAAGVWDAYLLGRDLLVAPVWHAGAVAWTTYLPAGEVWHHLWSGAVHAGGADVTVAAPLGAPPVFFRADSPHRALFERLGAIGAIG